SSNMYSLGKKVLGTCCMALVLSSTAWALDLGTAKNQGLVGETPSGYLANVKGNASPEISQLVNSINQKRKQEYVRIAKKTGATVASVETLAGQKAINNEPAGHFVFDGKSWRKK
ncbi:MAG: YdbL family protein, partial [Bdellovibrionales bacterium]|nr:YdbL family protein [Bdellovibrionales bacterium]